MRQPARLAAGREGLSPPPADASPPTLRMRHLTPSGCVTSHPADASPHTQRMRHLTPSGCVTSHPADASPHTQRMRHLPPCGCVTSHPADASPHTQVQHALITFRCCYHFCVIVSVVAGSLLRARHPQRCRWRSKAIPGCCIDVHGCTGHVNCA